MSGGDRKLLGRWGEAQTAEWLRKHGYQVLEANWHCRFGEIDLIVRKGNFLCFVEVKLRKNAEFAQAREFVDRHKREKLRTSAELYLSQNPTDLQLRFDVAEVYAPEGMQTQNPKINYLENAFQ